jgi:hypothetical protein
MESGLLYLSVSAWVITFPLLRELYLTQRGHAFKGNSPLFDSYFSLKN